MQLILVQFFLVFKSHQKILLKKKLKIMIKIRIDNCRYISIFATYIVDKKLYIYQYKYYYFK